ncbi:MAG: hypothetical protein HXX10_26975 [Rhodoplanes sp.]|uniref:hypothetical protein n=1 Tax=Rhodoplanes sp. TaxID=1968906 RepID=UPI001853F473|nr:hypothetical protein [Rhodoplanes sp.]NVO17684.1 hypothetical protein [Rhodoplanes sp.]
MPGKSLLIAATLVGGVTFYLVGLSTGAVTLVGFEQRRSEGRGIVSDNSGLQTDFRFFPVWLPTGGAVRADYEVDAELGSVAVSVSPPLLLKTSLQTATAYVAGRRSGSIVFVAREAGWYRFWSDATPIFGRRCHAPGASMVDIITGSDGCSSYKARYKVAWHLAGRAEPAAAGHVTIPIPAPNEKLATVRIGE